VAATAAPPAPVAPGTGTGSPKAETANDPAPTALPTPTVATEASAVAVPVATAATDEAAAKKAHSLDRTIFSMRDSIGPSGAGRRAQSWQKSAVGSAAIAGIPRRLILIGAGVLVLLLIVIVLMLTHNHAGVPKPTDVLITAPSGLDHPKLVQYPSPQSRLITTPGRMSRRTGQVVPASQVQRSGRKWYLMIITTLPQYAQHAARFIARHGVSVTVEPAAGGWDAVISVQGFRNLASPAAIAFRRRVVAIGLAWPGVQRTHHSPWNDAYFARVQRYP
ncbi:MAG: hypothetical protein HKL95_00350, partial [Phycisphaerae bacterium]|nr:hypothetical protein [Phycisphaerae bacterium]